MQSLFLRVFICVYVYLSVSYTYMFCPGHTFDLKNFLLQSASRERARSRGELRLDKLRLALVMSP